MNFTLNLNKSQAKIIIDKYQDYSLAPTNNYTLFKAKYKGATLIIFQTLSLLIQGNKSGNLYNEVCDFLNIQGEKHKEKGFESTINLSVIGTHEIGTKHFFGPIVVAAVYLDKSNIIPVMELGIRDTKKLSDIKVQEIAKDLKNLVTSEIIVLDNLKYNYLTSVANYGLNRILALLHNDVLFKLTQNIENYDSIVIDEFTPKDNYLKYISEQKHTVEKIEFIKKGETKNLAIACANILARNAYLKELYLLSDEIGFDLPKGIGSRVNLAITKILKEQSETILTKFGKTDFKNLEKAKNNL